MAAGTLVGRGYVTVEPDFSGFQEKVAKKLNSTLGPAMDRAGRNAGRRLSKSIGNDSSLRSSFQPILRRFQKEGDNLGEQLAKRVTKGAKRAEGDMFGLADAVKEVGKQSKATSSRTKAFANDTFGIAHAARDAGKSYQILRNATHDWGHEAKKVDSIGRRLSKGVTNLFGDFREVGANLRAAAGGFGNFEGVMARANRGFQFFRNILGSLKLPALAAGVALFAQSLSALAAGAVAAASALGPLSGALIAIPAAALAGAQAVGVLKLALAGIGDAVKAATAVQVQGGEQATQVLRKQENAAEAVADAHRTLASSERDAKFAEQDLTRARKEATRQLEDLRRASEESNLTEREGADQLRESRRELAKTLRNPEANGLEIRQAEEAVERAQFALGATREEAKRARADYAEAHKKGIKGMPEVVSAQRAVADANRSVADAERGVAKAVRENNDAMKQQGSAATALQQKMAELTPAGRKFAKFLISLKPRYDELRQVASKGFFPGAETGIKSALTNFGVLKGVIGETSSALGKLAAKAGQKLGSEAWGRDLAKIGESNTKIIERLGQAGLNLGDALRNVLVSAEPLIEWMSKGTEKFSEWAKTAAQTGRETGSLSHFFDETREAMEKVWHVLKPVGEGLLNVGHAARPLGNEILDSLGKAAEGWAKWTGSIEGQNQLSRYFKEVKPAIYAIGRLVRDLTDDFFDLGRQKGVATLVEAIRTKLLPLLTNGAGAITGFFSGFLDRFDDLRKEGVPAFDAFVQTLIEHAGEAGVKLAGALWRGFLNAGLLGKLAVGGWLFSKLGGISTAIHVGKLLGVGAGEAGASTLATSMGKALGPALGAVGIANIVTSATHRDWKDAGFEAGGALAGGIVGGLAGGPLGAAAGVGIGSVLGEALSGLFHSEKKLTPLQERLAETARNLADALHGQKQASEATAGAQEGVREAQQRVHHATAELRAAERNLTRDRQAHGSGSLQAIRDEERVKAKRKDTKRATEELQFTEEVLAFNRKAEGRSIAQVVHDSSLKVAADKQRLENIKHLIQSEGLSTEASEKWSRASKKYTEDLTTRNEALKQARHRNKDWADSLEEMTTAQHRFGKFGGALVTQIENLKDKIVELRQRGAENGGPMNPLNHSLQEAKGELRTAQTRLLNLLDHSGPKLKNWAQTGGGHVKRLGGAFESLSGTVSESLGTIQDNVSGMLKSFGVAHVPKFTIEYLHRHSHGGGKKYLNKLPEFATGGLAAIVPGNSTGDRHVLSIDGRPTAKVESREGIFVGNRKMMAAAKQANDAVPRFQEGGLAKRAAGGLVEPQLEGQAGSLKRLGQAAIHKVFEGAKGYLGKQKGALGGPLGSMNVSGSVADHPELKPGISAIVATILKRWPGLQITSTTGGGHATNSYHYLGRAADLGASTGYMLKAAAWIRERLGRNLTEGIHNPNLSIKYGKEVSSSFWGEPTWSEHLNHIHVAKQRGGLLGYLKGLQKGGGVKGIWAGTSIDKTYPKSDGYTGEIVPPYVIQALAEWAGLPGLTMYQITEGESGGHAGMDIPDPPGRSKGLYAINDHYNPQYGSSTEMRNPILNTLAAKGLVGNGLPNANIWHGSSHVTGWDLHYSGDPEAIAAHIGGDKEGTEGAPAGAPGKAAKSKEKPLKSYAGVSTSAVPFGHPKTLKATEAEIRKLVGKDGKGGLRKRYAKAAARAAKDGKPATADLLRKRVHSIDERVKGLRKQRNKLRLSEASKRLKKRIAGKLSTIEGYGQRVEGRQRAYEIAAQFAEQVVGLEPESPEVAPEPEVPEQAKGESDKDYEKKRIGIHNAYEKHREQTEKSYVGRYSDYIKGQESPAYQSVLERVADWRNTILRAESFGFGKGHPSVDRIGRGFEKNTRRIDHKIDHINTFTEKVGERVKAYREKVKRQVREWRHDHPRAKHLPGWLKDRQQLPHWLEKQKNERDNLRLQLPFLRDKDNQLREAIGTAREAFFPGGKNRLGPRGAGINSKFAQNATIPTIPLAGSGSLEDSLAQVQGIHPYPQQHEILGADALAPPRQAGRFGGVIWNVQESIEGLGLKIKQAASGIQKASLEKPNSPGEEAEDQQKTEREGLLEELLTKANQRLAIQGALGSTLSQFEATYPLPFAGTFHTGGTIAGPSSQEYVAKVRGAEHILTPEQMAALAPASEVAAGGAPVIESLVIHPDGSATMRFEGREFETAVQEVVRSTPRGLSNNGAGRAFRP